MQRFLSLKIELWAVLLICLLGLMAMIGFGFAAVDGERGAKRFGTLARTALFLSEMPDTVKAALKENTRMQAPDSGAFDGLPSGWATPDGGALPRIDGYLLHSRYDGDLRRPVVELIDLADWQIRHRWVIEADALLAGIEVHSNHAINTNWNSEYYRAIHPVLTVDGQLIFKDHVSPLISVDACARSNWRLPDHLAHHSSEVDAEGNVWVPSVIEPTTVSGVDATFFEDSLLQVSPQGKVLSETSLTQVLLRHGLAHLMFTNSQYSPDPLHLNDIQPVLADGPYWKKGDLFLSLRNISGIMLYRPSTDEIVWMKQGPWIAQHDVDILDDHRIAIFDNRAQSRGGRPFVEGHSQIAIFDFATGQDSTILDPLMAEEEMRTYAGALYEALPGGYHLIEDVTLAKFFLAGPTGQLAAEFTNRAADGKVYQLGWSRFVARQEGDLALSAMKGLDCNEP